MAYLSFVDFAATLLEGKVKLNQSRKVALSRGKCDIIYENVMIHMQEEIEEI